MEGNSWPVPSMTKDSVIILFRIKLLGIYCIYKLIFPCSLIVPLDRFLPQKHLSKNKLKDPLLQSKIEEHCSCNKYYLSLSILQLANPPSRSQFFSSCKLRHPKTQKLFYKPFHAILGQQSCINLNSRTFLHRDIWHVKVSFLCIIHNTLKVPMVPKLFEF